MLTIIYCAIILFVIALVVWNLFTEQKLVNQLTCAVVIIPLVLRFLMIK